jgi:DNA polymerase I
MYGRGAWSLSEEHGWSEAQGAAYVRAFWEAFPRYYEWYQKTERQAITEGFVLNSLGRKRRWNLITPETRNEIMRQAVNSPLQSLASDLCLSSLIRLTDLLRDRDLGYVLTTVHDSIEFEVRTDRLFEGLTEIHDVMTTPTFETCAEFPIDTKVGPNWQDSVKWSYGQEVQ